MIGRDPEQSRLMQFINSGDRGATLGIVWGRRRVGKSFLLEGLAEQTGGFYFHATRGSSAEALRDLGERLGLHQNVGAPLALPDWDRAIEALMALGRERETLVVLDEFPYLLEHTPELDSIIQRAFGPRHAARTSSRARVVLCGSAISVMSKLLSGTAPLRGRAGIDLRVLPFDFRTARQLHDITHLPTAVATYAVIGGVAAYACEMSENDRPIDSADFTRWICRRVLSPAAPLFSEIELLLSEDPETSKARKLNLYHATLAAVAQGHHAWNSICNYVKAPGTSLVPIINALVAAALIDRVDDPMRDKRPTYHPADSLLRFHYAILRRHQSRLARHDANTAAPWTDIEPTFRSLVLGPSFEAMARFWTQQFASRSTLGGAPDYVGTTTLALAHGQEQEVDVVVALNDGATPADRTVIALGEAKVGETITLRHVEQLEQARKAIGARGGGAKLLLFGCEFAEQVLDAAASRPDIELIDVERLYTGA